VDMDTEYGKADTNESRMAVPAHTRGPESAELRLLPQLWARNTWSWRTDAPRPKLFANRNRSIHVEHPRLGPMTLAYDGEPEVLFCENDTNTRRLFGANAPGFFKDGINDYIVHGNQNAVNPAREGTKVATHYRTR